MDHRIRPNKSFSKYTRLFSYSSYSLQLQRSVPDMRFNTDTKDNWKCTCKGKFRFWKEPAAHQLFTGCTPEHCGDTNATTKNTCRWVGKLVIISINTGLSQKSFLLIHLHTIHQNSKAQHNVSNDCYADLFGPCRNMVPIAAAAARWWLYAKYLEHCSAQALYCVNGMRMMSGQFSLRENLYLLIC